MRYDKPRILWTSLTTTTLVNAGERNSLVLCERRVTVARRRGSHLREKAVCGLGRGVCVGT
jgi:hypothetical protein